MFGRNDHADATYERIRTETKTNTAAERTTTLFPATRTNDDEKHHHYQLQIHHKLQIQRQQKRLHPLQTKRTPCRNNSSSR